VLISFWREKYWVDDTDLCIAGKGKNLGVIASIIFFHALVPVMVLFIVCYWLHRESWKIKHRKGNCNVELKTIFISVIIIPLFYYLLNYWFITDNFWFRWGRDFSRIELFAIWIEYYSRSNTQVFWWKQDRRRWFWSSLQGC